MKSFKIYIGDVVMCRVATINSDTMHKIRYIFGLKKKHNSEFIIMEESSESQQYLTTDEINVLRNGGKTKDGNFISTSANLLNIFQNDGAPQKTHRYINRYA